MNEKKIERMFCYILINHQMAKVNRHCLSEIFKTTEYTEINRKNYWHVRQLVCTWLSWSYLFDMFCKSFWSFFCCSIFVKKQKTMKNQMKFVGNSRSFAPPSPELNFRHWCQTECIASIAKTCKFSQRKCTIETVF